MLALEIRQANYYVISPRHSSTFILADSLLGYRRFVGTFDMTDPDVLRKDQLEIRLHNEKKLIHEGALKDENPLDLSEGFRQLCEACRKGDLKVCQEKISEGVNINARDTYDYTPLILVGDGTTGTFLK